MPARDVRFTNDRGTELAGRLELPTCRPLAYAVFAHCFTCGSDIKAAVTIARRLAERGIATLRFDFTGLGRSEGEFRDSHFTANARDLVAAARHLEAAYGAPTLLVGHSLGGAAVLQAAAELPGVRAVATIGAPAEPGHVLDRFDADELARVHRDGEAEVTIAGRSFRVSSDFVDDLQQAAMDRIIGGLRRALLVLHAPFDNVVGIDNASRIFTAAKHPKSFVTLDDADHLLSDRRQAAYAADVIWAWAQKYVPAESDPDAGKPRRVLAQLGDEGYQVHLCAGPHRLEADEPADLGGTDRGPTPYDLLAAALGACTAMTLQMYARRKGWALDDVRVELTHEKRHADDCAHCETTDGKIDWIGRRIHVGGEINPDQRARLLEIADRCPVHRTLHREVVVDSSWWDDAGAGAAED